MKLENYLNSFDEQKEVEDAEIVISENPKLKLIFEKYEEWIKEPMLLYEYCARLLNGIKCSVKDVRDLSVALKKYEQDKKFEFCGIFLSYLINTSDEDNFCILTNQFNTGLSYLGYSNSKNLTIIGNTNNFTGAYMERGVLTVKGHVNNNAGEGLKDGMINITGNVFGGNLGAIADGGEIYVEGEIRDSQFILLTGNCSAKIYHKGTRVWPK